MINLVKKLLALILAPYKWIRALIKGDRFLCYPGQLNIFIGLPGSGKSLGMVAMWQRSKHMYLRTAATEDAGIKDVPLLTLDYWRRWQIKRTLIMIDESALNGFFARDWASNFADKKGSKNKLSVLKLRRHLHDGIIITTQSFGDNDNIIRSMANNIYVCSHWILPGYCIAQKAIIWYEFDDQGNYSYHVDTPTFFEKLTNPYQFKIYSIRKYKRFYNSFQIPEEYSNLPEYDCVKPVDNPVENPVEN